MRVLRPGAARGQVETCTVEFVDLVEVVAVEVVSEVAELDLTVKRAGVEPQAGRRDTNTPGIPQHSPPGNTAIFRLDRDGVTPVFALPSSGDAAYPGLVSLEEDRLIVSYYSPHAYLSGAVEGEKRSLHHIERWGALRRAAPPPDYPLELSYYKNGPADIYVAEIDLAAEGAELSF